MVVSQRSRRTGLSPMQFWPVPFKPLYRTPFMQAVSSGRSAHNGDMRSYSTLYPAAATASSIASCCSGVKVPSSYIIP